MLVGPTAFCFHYFTDLRRGDRDSLRCRWQCVSRRAADVAVRIAAGCFAGEAHLHAVAQTDGWNTTEPQAAAALRIDGQEPGLRRATCSGGTPDSVASA